MRSWYDVIEMMKNLIDENISENPSLSEISKHFGYSYFYASKKFREIEGISFREYLQIRKIVAAASELYSTTERTVDIAVKYGYSSQEAFTRSFVKIFGVTPVVYRRMQKPTSFAEKNALLGTCGATKPHLMNGGKDMKLHVKQMFDWNCYALYAEDVDEQYWHFFQAELWWQVGNSFIKTYDNVRDFEHCAENFTKYGEISIKQQLKIVEAPWRKALDLFIADMKKIDVDWYIHGSAAMALWGIEVAPKNLNIIVPNYSDFDKVREAFYKLALTPIERCDNWIMSGGGTIFMEANIGIWLHNKELEPYDMSGLEQIDYNSEKFFISSLEMLRQDNEYYGRPERVRLIEERMSKDI